MCLGSDPLLKRNRNVLSMENLFLILDHMFMNRKILSEAQKIGNNCLWDGLLKNFVRESSHSEQQNLDKQGNTQW